MDKSELKCKIDFAGEYYHTLDGKNRFVLPSKLRQIPSKKIFITRGIESCLYLFPKQNWEIIISKLDNLPIQDKNKERAFKRLFFANAIETEIDVGGRILLPQIMCKYAKIKKQIVIIGVRNKIEIWAQEQWLRYRKKAENYIKEIAPQFEF